MKELHTTACRKEVNGSQVHPRVDVHFSLSFLILEPVLFHLWQIDRYSMSRVDLRPLVELTPSNYHHHHHNRPATTTVVQSSEQISVTETVSMVT